MNSRVQLILSLVRDKLRSIKNDEITDEVLYMYSRLVLNDIIYRTEALRKSQVITLVTNQSEYDISSYAMGDIEKIVPSWTDSTLEFKRNNTDRELSMNLTGETPTVVYRDIDSLVFYPTPVCIVTGKQIGRAHV